MLHCRTPLGALSDDKSSICSLPLCTKSGQTRYSVPNPGSSHSVGAASFDDGNGTLREYLTITYQRNLAADDVLFEAQIATDLAGWATLGTTYVSATHNGDGTETRTYRSTAPLASISREFIWLQVRAR